MAKAAQTTILDLLEKQGPHEWASAATIARATACVERGHVTRPKVSQGHVAAYVRDERKGRVCAELRVGASGLVALCTCRRGRRNPCAHATALALLLTAGALPGSTQDEAGDGGESGDEAAGATLDVERQRRMERGRTGLFAVEPESLSVLGAHVVSSPSGLRYRVVLRSLDEDRNSCTCRDFLTSRLGTCKHIEAVRHFLHTSRRGRALLAKARGRSGETAHLYLAHDPETAVRLWLPTRADGAMLRVAERWFDAAGRLIAAFHEVWPALSQQARRAGIEVPAEVESFARRTLDAAASGRRQAAIEAEVRRAGTAQPGFHGRLYPYQVDGLAFLASRGRALLADDMGLGKTAQAIAATARLLRSGDVRCALVVCPASLKHQWAQEIERFVGPGVRTTVIQGARELRHAQYQSEAGIFITSYELLRTDEKEVAQVGPDLLILDEAQRIKNWKTRTADVVKRIATPFVFVLTGTPLENRLDDLYSLMQVVDPHVLGPLWRFNQDFTKLDERGRAVGYLNLGELRRRIAPYFLRRRKEEVLDQLPERITTRVVMPLDERQRGAHDEAQEQVGRLLAILKRRPLSPIEEQKLLRAFQRMRMACDAAALCGGPAGGSPKLEELERLLEDLCVQGDHKVVVFSEWEKMQALAAAVATKLGVGHVRLHGGVPTPLRPGLIERFREDPACKVFFSTDAGGTGLNLQAADYVINVDLPWNPAILAQRIARVHRLGQKRAVNVVLLLAESSIETRMEATLQAKRALFEAAVGDDTQTEELDRTSLARRLSTLLAESYAASTGPVPVANAAGADGATSAPETTSEADPLAAIKQRLGGTLRKILRARDGRIVAVVADGADAAGGGAALASVIGGALALTEASEAALAVFGDASPLAGAAELFVAPKAADPLAAVHRALLDVSGRKLAGARALLTAGQPAEALALLRDALALACRAAADHDPGDDSGALLVALYRDLLPQGKLLAADAHALTRASDLARAFAMSATPPPAELVSDLAAEAAALIARVRQSRGQNETMTGALPAPGISVLPAHGRAPVDLGSETASGGSS